MCTQKKHKKEDEAAKSHVIRLNFGQKIGIKNKTSSSSYIQFEEINMCNIREI